MTEFSYLATPTATREVVERFGLGLKKSLGQNFLVNDAIIGKILALAEVSADDRILEVGPGIGTLTAALLAACAEVVSIERDPRLYEVLPQTLGQFQNFHLIQKDALDVTRGDIARALGLEGTGAPHGVAACAGMAHRQQTNTSGLGFPNKMVANLPYAVAATVILDYFERFAFLQSATVMVQREVAQRICAQPGNKNYGAYTVKLSLFARVQGSFPVAPGNFMPPPHVESTVVRLDREAPLLPTGEAAPAELIQATCTVADAAFHLRRKTIANSMRAYFSSDPAVRDAVPELLSAAGIDEKRRGETLDQHEFLRLGQCFLDHRSSL